MVGREEGDLGDANEVCDGVSAGPGGAAREDLLLGPEADVVEAAREGDDVGRLPQLLLLVPRARAQLLPTPPSYASGHSMHSIRFMCRSSSKDGGDRVFLQRSFCKDGGAKMVFAKMIQEPSRGLGIVLRRSSFWLILILNSKRHR